MLLVVVFCLGFVAASALSWTLPTKESPFSTKPVERASPGDTITEQEIKVYKNNVQVDLQDPEGNDWMVMMDLDNPSWSTFTDTNSMDPVFDVGANTVRIKVPADSLQVGDIISYQYGDKIIIHRIVHIDQDEQGLYFVLKGDNNPTSDPMKVRPDQILGKVVAIFY